MNCQKYDNEKDQPMKVYMSFQAWFLMNVHAHLFTNEIIGYNAGYVIDGDKQKILVIHDSIV